MSNNTDIKSEVKTQIKSEAKTEEEDLRKNTGELQIHYNPDLQEQTNSEKNSLLNEPADNCVFEAGDPTNSAQICDDLIKWEVNIEETEALGDSGRFSCSVCGEHFMKENSFLDHILSHFSCKSSKRKKTTNLSDELHTKSNGTSVTISGTEKPHKCTECSYAAACKSHLKEHLMTHSGEKPFKCSKCSYSTAQKRRLKRHFMTHTGEKPFKCAVCPYSVAYKSNLKHHMKTHTGEKPYKCSECSYSAAMKVNLDRHLMTHTGEKPFKCTECPFSATCKSRVSNHYINMHAGQ